MKKSLLVLFCLNLFFYQSNAQSTSKGGDDNFAQEGDNLINVYYGVSLLNSVYKAAASAGSSNITTRSLGPVGLVYEYVVTEGIGIGVELGYTQFIIKFDEGAFVNSAGVTEVYSSEFNFTTIRAMARANFHFAHNEKFDAYLLVSAGYRKTDYTFKTTDPNGSSSATFPGIIPFGVKPGLGLRYYFTKNLGCHTEFALGTPMLCAGLSFKFN